MPGMPQQVNSRGNLWGVLKTMVENNIAPCKRVINKTGSAIAKDKVVAVVNLDTTTTKPKIVLADADNILHDDLWVTLDDIADGAEGYVFKGGLSQDNLNTNSVTAAGDPVYLSTTAGGFTVTAPTQRAIIVGWVTVKSATVGQIQWDVNGITQGISGSSVSNVANVNTVGGVPVLFRITSAATGDIDVVMDHKVRVIDAWIVNTAAGGAGDTITVKNGANAITDAMDANKADTTITRATQINDANHEIAAAGTLRITNASDAPTIVYVSAIRVA